MLSVGERFTANTMPLQLSDDFFIEPESIHALLPSNVPSDFHARIAGTLISHPAEGVHAWKLNPKIHKPLNEPSSTRVIDVRKLRRLSESHRENIFSQHSSVSLDNARRSNGGVHGKSAEAHSRGLLRLYVSYVRDSKYRETT